MPVLRSLRCGVVVTHEVDDLSTLQLDLAHFVAYTWYEFGAAQCSLSSSGKGRQTDGAAALNACAVGLSGTTLKHARP